MTGGIQTGALRQPTLLPFAEQRGQAPRDASITDGNLAELAGGLAHLLANDPAYTGQAFKDYAPPRQPDGGRRDVPPTVDFRAAVKAAQAEMATALGAGCGGPVSGCAEADIGRFGDGAALDALVASTQTYGLSVVHPETAGMSEDVGELAPEAGYLLTVAFPALTLGQANGILTETEGAGGGLLDDGSGFGVCSRLNLRAAAVAGR